MTPRDRVLAALAHKETDLTPFSWGFGINDPAKEDLLAYTGLPDMAALDAYLAEVDDSFFVYPGYIGPADRNFYDAQGVRTDEWGVRWKFQSFGKGGYEEQESNPLEDFEEAEELEDYLFPSADWWDFSRLAETIRQRNRETPRIAKIGIGNLYESATYMRGFENILMDTIVNKEFLHALMRKVTDYFIAFFTKALEAAGGLIDIVFTADDVGGQEGLLLSPEAIAEFITPYHKEMNAKLHSYGVKVMFHTCGAVTDAVPMLIGCGVDILESLQFYTKGMEPGLLKERFGDRLCFHGGVSVQKTLVTGSPRDVANEVKWLRENLGPRGGYILAPAHHIQAGTPPENILAMVAAAGRPLPEGVKSPI